MTGYTDCAVSLIYQDKWHHNSASDWRVSGQSGHFEVALSRFVLCFVELEDLGERGFAVQLSLLIS